MKGRLGSPYSAPHEVVTAVGFAALRRYRASNPPAEADLSTDGRRPALLFVPPLMVTASSSPTSFAARAACYRSY